jgi:hypothetical protein
MYLRIAENCDLSSANVKLCAMSLHPFPYMKKYCDSEKNSQVLTDFHDLSPPEYEKVFCGMPHVCCCVFVYGCMSSSLAPERVVGFNFYSILKNLLVTGLCPMNPNILAKETGVFTGFPKYKFAVF